MKFKKSEINKTKNPVRHGQQDFFVHLTYHKSILSLQNEIIPNNIIVIRYYTKLRTK